MPLPSFAAFKTLSQPGSCFPFVKQIDFFESPSVIYTRWARRLKPSVLLESARLGPSTGRISLIAENPFLIFESKGRTIKLKSGRAVESFEADPLQNLKEILRRFSSPPGLTPYFTGGAIGYFGYEVKNLIEPHLTASAKESYGLPDIYLLFFDEGIVVDHGQKCVFLFSNALVGPSFKDSYERGLRQLKALERRFKRRMAAREIAPARKKSRRGARAAITHQFTRRDFVEKVKKIKEYIRRGDIYQANLSQRFSFPVNEPAFQIYEKLKKVNPSPFFGFLDAGAFQIISGSPERLVKLENGRIQTRPIAGTRWRGKTQSEDLRLSRELVLDEKERAEHIMLVDLERNDMGRVARVGSVGADELMGVEDYSHVKHIVSNISGALREGLDSVDVLKAFFPGGTITGAPKIRCMEILDEIEPLSRGPYTGSLGYLGFNGDMDLNILIRSLVVKDKKAYLQVGAGIVADSVPEKEYDETLHKAEGLLKAVFGEERTDAFFDRCRRT